MKKQKSVTLNYLMNCILTASSMIFPLLSYPYVSKILQPEGMGKVAFANSFIAYFALIAMLGIPTYGIRACAKVRDDKKALSKVVWQLLSVNLIMTIAVYILFGICLFTVPRISSEKALFAWMSLSILFQMLGVEWLFKALEEYSYITVRSVLFKAAALVLMFLCIHEKEDYVIYGVLTLAAAMGSNLCNLFYMRRFISPMGQEDFTAGIYAFYKDAIKIHIKPICVFFAMAAASTIYTNLDVVMLNFMQGDVQTGYYSCAVKIKGVLVSFVTALGAVLLPRMSYYAEKKNDREFRRLIQKAFLFVAATSIPLCIFFIFFAKGSILILSGEAFLPAEFPMQIIMPTLVFIGFSNLIGIQILVPLGMEKQVLYSEIVGALVDVCLNLWLIPSMGAAGAAIGTLAAEAVVLFYQIGVMIKLRNKGVYNDTGKNQTL